MAFVTGWDAGGYCPDCEVFGPTGEPCWMCGTPTKGGSHAVIVSGHRHDVPTLEHVIIEGVTLQVEEYTGSWA